MQAPSSGSIAFGSRLFRFVAYLLGGWLLLSSAIALAIFIGQALAK